MSILATGYEIPPILDSPIGLSIRPCRCQSRWEALPGKLLHKFQRPEKNTRER